MISLLRGTIHIGAFPYITIDVNGVGYEAQCSNTALESVSENEEGTLHIYTYVREDRLELFGFATSVERNLFAQFLGVSGVGPKMALQLASVPSALLVSACETNDTRMLSSIKGVGKKMAEKLLLELKGLVEKGVLVAAGSADMPSSAAYDDDALEALMGLGYDRRSVMKKLQEIPSDISSTEDRVKHVLQAL